MTAGVVRSTIVDEIGESNSCEVKRSGVDLIEEKVSANPPKFKAEI